MKDTEINKYLDSLSVSDKLTIQLNKMLFNNEQKADLLEDLAKWLQDGTSVMDAVNSWATYNKDGSKYIAQAMIWANSNSKYGLYDGLTGWYDSSVIIALRNAKSKQNTVDALFLCSKIIRKSGGFLGKFIVFSLIPLVFWTIGFAFRGYAFTHFNLDIIALFEGFAPEERWTPSIKSFVDGIYDARTWIVVFPLCFILSVVFFNILMRYRANLVTIYNAMLASKFLQGLATLTANGVRMKDSLLHLKKGQSPYVLKHIDEMLMNINEGKQNNADIIDTGFIPQSVIGRYKVLSQSKSGGEALVKSSLSLAESANKKSISTLKFISFVLLVSAIIYIAFTYMNLLVSMGDIKQLI